MLGTGTHLVVTNGATLTVGAGGLAVGSGTSLLLDPTASLVAPLVLGRALLVLRDPAGAAANVPRAISGPVVLAARATLSPADFDHTGTLTLSGPISGSGGLGVGGYSEDLGRIAQQTESTFVLSGTGNAYAGGTSLNGGTLVPAAPGAIGSGPISVGAGPWCSTPGPPQARSR